jgi:hypothetical protein
MQASQDALRRSRHVILHDGAFDAQGGVPVSLEMFEEESPGIHDHLRFNDDHFRDFGGGYFHEYSDLALTE